MMMKVVILCGGLGTRLREETEFRPKPMIEIGGKPILWHIMRIYSHFGFKEFILCLGYKGEMIKEYFYNYEILSNDFTIELGKRESIEMHAASREVGWKITFADTGDAALKGARLKRIEKYITGDTFMVTYGDGLADVDIPGLLKFHKRHKKIATVTGVNAAARFGELKIQNGRVAKFFEKRTAHKEFINGGFFVFDKRIFRYLEDKDSCDLEYGILEQLAARQELVAYLHRGFWACMDTLRDVEYLNQLWHKNRADWKVWDG